jgi:hypothetical protein
MGRDESSFGLPLEAFSSSVSGEDLEYMFKVDGRQQGPIYRGVHRLAWDDEYGTNSFDSVFENRVVDGGNWTRCASNLVHAGTDWNWSITQAASGCAGYNRAGGFMIHGGPDAPNIALKLYGLNQYMQYEGFRFVEIYVRRGVEP